MTETGKEHCAKGMNYGTMKHSDRKLGGKLMDYEKLEKLFKTMFALTLLMAIFSTGMTVATIKAEHLESISMWKPIGQALLIMGPVLIGEWYGFKHFQKKAEVVRAERERLEKEREKAERKAKAEERRAKQQNKKKKK